MWFLIKYVIRNHIHILVSFKHRNYESMASHSPYRLFQILESYNASHSHSSSKLPPSKLSRLGGGLQWSLWAKCQNLSDIVLSPVVLFLSKKYIFYIIIGEREVRMGFELWINPHQMKRPLHMFYLSTELRSNFSLLWFANSFWIKFSILNKLYTIICSFLGSVVYSSWKVIKLCTVFEVHWKKR